MRNGTKKRGRPASYDRAAVSEAIRDRFWLHGFSATSLDDLSAATGLARPSLYGGFGDKAAMYTGSLAQFRADAVGGMAEALAAPRLADALSRFFAAAIGLYLGGEGAQGRGCYILCTAVAEAAARPDVRAELDKTLSDIDGAIEARIRLAVEGGELDADTDAAARAAIVTAGLHSLALRARAGQTRDRLEQLTAAIVSAAVA